MDIDRLLEVQMYVSFQLLAWSDFAMTYSVLGMRQAPEFVRGFAGDVT